MHINYLIIFIVFSLISAFFTLFVRRLALRLDIIDLPDKSRAVDTLRKIHDRKIPLLGGMAVFLAFFLGLFIFREKILSGNLEAHHWLGVFAGAIVIMLGGFLDDKYDLRPKWQIVWPMIAAVCVILGGVEIEKITNPMGGYLYLNTKFIFVSISDILVFAWLMGMMYTTKILDGVDGLLTGVAGLGSLIIFLFTMTSKYFQPDIGLAALILASACFGFLVFNWHPAKIFLGEGGSLFLGFILGVLAIISGGKIAIALLIMGIPILDVLWAIIRRLANGQNPFKKGDRKHLHHRFLDLGLGQRKTVLIYYLFVLSFGLSALFLQSLGKLFALLILFVVMMILVFGFTIIDQKSSK